jgi:hypothetical protein
MRQKFPEKKEALIIGKVTDLGGNVVAFRGRN